MLQSNMIEETALLSIGGQAKVAVIQDILEMGHAEIESLLTEEEQ